MDGLQMPLTDDAIEKAAQILQDICQDEGLSAPDAASAMSQAWADILLRHFGTGRGLQEMHNTLADFERQLAGQL